LWRTKLWNSRSHAHDHKVSILPPHHINSENGFGGSAKYESPIQSQSMKPTIRISQNTTASHTMNTPSATRRPSVRFNEVVRYDDGDAGSLRGKPNPESTYVGTQHNRWRASLDAVDRRSIVDRRDCLDVSVDLTRKLSEELSFDCPPMPPRVPERKTSKTNAIKDCPAA
jgi:hypothetical protein